MSLMYLTAPEARIRLNTYRRRKGLVIYSKRNVKWNDIATMARSTIRAALWSDNELIRICQIEAAAKHYDGKYLRHRY